jgi:hypothetical protein
MPWQHGPRICNAHKRDGSPCGQPAVRGMTKCRMHGGRTPSGPGHGAFRHGRYSKVLPVRLAARYEEAVSSPRLLSLRNDLAVCESRLMDLFGRVDTGESGALWQALREALDAFALAQAAGDIPAMTRGFATMRQLVRQGSDDSQAWAEIYRVWDTRSKLTQQETKTLVAMQQMVTTQQLATMFGVITDAITTAVLAHADEGSGRKILAQISEEFQRLSVREADIN